MNNSGTIGSGGITVTNSSFNGILDSGKIVGGIKIDGASGNPTGQNFVIDVSGATFFGGGISTAGTLSSSSAEWTLFVDQVSTFSGGITNSGIISAHSADMYVNAGTFSGGISNSGTLNQAATGIWLVNTFNSSGGITNSGTITDGRYGIWVSNKGTGKSETFAGGISNGGTITSGVFRNRGHQHYSVWH